MERLTLTDIVVIPPHHDDSDWSDGLPAGDPPVQLLPDLALTRLASDDVRMYDAACEPRHLNFDPGGDGGQRYAFVRHPAPATPHGLHNFDSDGVLHAALAMSRYLVLNAHCTEIAVRRIEGLRPEPQVVAVRPINRFYAWRARDGTRTHLTQDDAQQLGPLLARYLADQDRLPPRVRGAVWFCETSFRTYYYEVASVHVVTALESLLKVRRGRATEQFSRRVPALARAVGIQGMTRRRAAAFYNRRSRAVHGRFLRVDAAAPATRELAAMQRLLVTVLRKAIEDQDFRRVFTAPRIEQRWPV